MNILKRFLTDALISISVFALVGVTGVGAEPKADESSTQPPTGGAHEETSKYIPSWKKWQRDIAQFDDELRKLTATAKVPEKKPLEKRLESRTGEVEVITDGSGGVVDFNAAKGTVQYEASEKFGGMLIDWDFELIKDTEIYWNKSTKLIPKIARTAKDGKQESEHPVFAIRIAKASTGPFQAGDRVRLKASIDDFSRFRKGYTRATGLVAIYYLEDSPNPAFMLRLDEAEVNLAKGANQDAAKSESAKPKETSGEGR